MNTRVMNSGDILTEDMFFCGLMVIVNDGKKDNKYIIDKVQPMRRFNEDRSRLLPPYDYEVILRKKGNIWFSLNKFNAGESWVRKITTIECRETFENLFKKNCINCQFCSYESGDNGDPEGFVCTKKDLYGKDEAKMLAKMESSTYRARQKKCFQEKEVQS